MEIPPWFLYPAVFFASLFLLLKLFYFHRPKLNLPPGPKPWPIIGNLNLIGSLPHRSIDKLSKKYGPLMQIQFGSYPVVVASSSDMAKEILRTHDITFSGRPVTAAGKYTTYNNSDIVWSQYGPYWRQARKMCISQLFTSERLDSYKHIRVEEVRSFLHGLYVSNGPISLKDHLLNVSLSVISRMVLGKKYLGEEADDMSKSSNIIQVKFKEMIEEFFYLNGVLNIGDSIPWLGFMDLQGYVKRMKVLSKKFDRFLEHVLDEHNAKKESVGKDKFVAKDMVDVLLGHVDDPNLDVKFTRTSVKAFTLDLILGGTGSSAVIVEWALSELLKNPTTMKKATEELDRVIGKGRWVDEKDISKLPYIEAIVKETMRMHPVIPLLLPRVAREDCKISGYDILAGTRAFVNTWSIGRDPTLWKEPEVFQPERFIGNSIDVKGYDFELLPFGSGRRMCLGYPLGIKVVQSSLANLLHGFVWNLPEKMVSEDLNMEEIWGLSSPKKIPLTAVAKPRLPDHLYQKCGV